MMKKSFLALALALCLLITATPMDTLAEGLEIRSEAVDAIVPELEGELALEDLEFMLGDEEGYEELGAFELPGDDDALPTVEPTLEPSVEPSLEPSVEPLLEPTADPSVEPSPEPAVETSVEPTAEPVAEPSAEPADEPAPEPATEPSAEPEPAPEPEASIEPAEPEAVEPQSEDVVAEVMQDEATEEPAEAPVEPEAVAPETELEAYTIEESGEEPPAPEAEAEPADAPLIAAGEAALSLNESALVLPVGESYALVTTCGSGGVTWSSDNAAVATVDETGVVKAVGVGTAKIVATDAASATVACAVTVPEGPVNVAFEETAITIGVKEKRALPRLVWGSNATVYQGSVTYTTSAKKRATISAEGVVKGVKTGAATITAALENGQTLQCQVTVKKAPKKITVTPKTLSMGVGETRAMTYKLSKGSGGTVTWTSSNAAVASVDAKTGLIKAIAPGKAKITAKTYNKKKAKVTVTVCAAPKSVAFPTATLNVGIGEKVALNAFVDSGAYSAMNYATSNGNVASLSGGQVVGVAAGEAQITVSTYNGLTATCKVVVMPAPTSVSLPYKTLYLGKGDSLQLEPSLGGGASQLKYSSSKKKIAKVSASGVVKAVKKGTAYITIKTFNNKKFKLKVVVKKAPSMITPSATTLRLGLGEAYTLGYTLPGGCMGAVKYASSAPDVVKVDPDTGKLTGLAIGSSTITLTTYNGKTAACAVTVYPAPTSISLDQSSVSVAVKQTVKLSPKLSDGSWANVVYESDNKAVATVASDGTITGVGTGQAVIHVRTFVPGVETQITVTVWDAPSSISLDSTTRSINLGETFQITPKIPVGSMTVFTYKSSDESVATVSDSGLVKGLKRGTAKITVSTHNGKSAVLTLKVYDPNYPDALTLKEAVPVMHVGDAWQAEVVVEPATAEAQLTWTSSDSTVATVDQEGFIQAKGFGVTTIKAVSGRNSSLVLKFTIAVENDDLTLVIPARTTGIAGISENLKLINNIKSSALKEIDRLKSAGAMSSSAASKRKTIVENIFKSYAFPWMTPSKQSYWKAANSEGGAKDFKPGIVYYGMPYISGSGKNRYYTAAKAVSEGRYTSSGQGYYLLNKQKLLNGKYVGCDCSGLVNVSIWGTESGHSADRTGDIAVNSAYTTVSSYTSMQPGDLLCKANSHVVMFLYYASADKSKIMIIENGGSEAGTNTVHCSVMSLSGYKNGGYRVRRLAGL